MLDKLMQKLGLKFEDLKPHEQEEYLSMLNTLAQKPLSVEDIKQHIQSMRRAVENELVDTEEFTFVLCFRVVNRKHVGLKARLKNYILLESFFESKERAKKVLEEQLKTRMSNIGG